MELAPANLRPAVKDSDSTPFSRVNLSHQASFLKASPGGSPETPVELNQRTHSDRRMSSQINTRDDLFEAPAISRRSGGSLVNGFRNEQARQTPLRSVASTSRLAELDGNEIPIPAGAVDFPVELPASELRRTRKSTLGSIGKRPKVEGARQDTKEATSRRFRGDTGKVSRRTGKDVPPPGPSIRRSQAPLRSSSVERDLAFHPAPLSAESSGETSRHRSARMATHKYARDELSDGDEESWMVVLEMSKHVR